MEVEPTRVEHRMGLYSNGVLLALPTSIRLGWKCMEVKPTGVEHRMGLYSNGMLLALPTSIRLGSEAYQSGALYGTLL